MFAKISSGNEKYNEHYYSWMPLWIQFDHTDTVKESWGPQRSVYHTLWTVKRTCVMCLQWRLAPGKYRVSDHYYYLCILTKHRHWLTPESLMVFMRSRRWHYSTVCIYVLMERREMGHTLQEMNSFGIWNNYQLHLTLSVLPMHWGSITTTANLIVTQQLAFLQSSLEKASFVRLYLVSQGRLPLMGVNDMLGVAAQHREKDALAWVILHSLYHARIVSHANTGKAGGASIGTGRSHLFSCHCFPNLKAGLVLLDTGEALSPRMRSTLAGNEQVQLTTSTL